MIESAQFLESLEHDNPDRPRFTIKPGLYENMEIGFRGQVMCVPMAEVLGRDNHLVRSSDIHDGRW